MGIDFIAATRDQFAFEKLVTHRFDLSDINHAIQTAASGEAIRVAILP
jgi:Zn-dependent alcohol dehydrogenase